MAEHPALKVAAQKWGSHPMGWPVPPRRRAMLRCYKAMLGLPVERLPTYAEVIASLRSSPEGEANG